MIPAEYAFKLSIGMIEKIKTKSKSEIFEEFLFEIEERIKHTINKGELQIEFDYPFFDKKNYISLFYYFFDNDEDIKKLKNHFKLLGYEICAKHPFQPKVLISWNKDQK